MSLLYFFQNKLLFTNNKAATNSSCCCFHCPPCDFRCGCYTPSISYQQLWDNVQEYVDLIELSCSNGLGELAPRVPINCGQWKPKFTQGPGGPADLIPTNLRSSCCNKICYDIYEYVASFCNLSITTLQMVSPSELDQRCSNTIPLLPTRIPDSFPGNNPESKYYLWALDTSKKISDPIKDISLSKDLLPRDFFSYFLPSVVDFAKLKNLNFDNVNQPSGIVGVEAGIVEQLLKSGSYPPYSGVEYYTDLETCRNCYGALYKLGTPDSFGRQSTVEMSGTLLNANSGDQIANLNLLLQTSETLPISECIAAKFSGDPITPYGILTNELSNSQSFINSSVDIENGYVSFDISYLYEITWDDINTEDPAPEWIPFTNKWKAWKGNISSEFWSISGYSGNITRYDNYKIPELLSINSSGLVFNPINTGVTLTSQWSDWYGSGVLIGNNDCDFEDQPFPFDKLGTVNRLQPTITISSTGTGSGCSFTPTLEQQNDPNGSPYWTITEVTINGSGSGYTNNEILKVTIATGDVEEVPATLRLLTTLPQTVQPQISGIVNANSSSPAILSVSTEEYQNNPKRWRVNNISVTNQGAGYSDGVYTIDFEPYNGSTEVSSATAIAVTERIKPQFSATIVANISEPSLNATVDAPCSSPAILGLIYTKYQTNPDRYRISNINLIDNGAGYDDGVYEVVFSALYGTTIATPASVIATTRRSSPSYEYNLITTTGLGASIASTLSLNTITNNLGQKAWNFDNIQCGDAFPFTILDAGYGYSSGDYIEISIENSVIDPNFGGNTITQYETNKWRLSLQVDEETGSIISINNNETFTTEAFYISTGEIDVVKIVPVLNSPDCGHSYPNDNEILYGGSYYKQGSGADLTVDSSLVKNSNGQKTWTFTFGVCGYGISGEGGGTGYTDDDYIEIILESNAVKDTLFDSQIYNPSNSIYGPVIVQETEPRKLRIQLATFEGSIYGFFPAIDPGDPTYIFSREWITPAYYKGTGKIERVIETSSLLTGQSCVHNYPNDNAELFGGSYYKEIAGGVPTGVAIDQCTNPLIPYIPQGETSIIFGCEQFMGPWNIEDENEEFTSCPAGWTEISEPDSPIKYCYKYEYKTLDLENPDSNCGCPEYSSTNPYFGKWPTRGGESYLSAYIENPLRSGPLEGPAPGSIEVPINSALLKDDEVLCTLICRINKYYHPVPATVRAISGPCITNIEADIWHPGPCGINTILETETSMNTPWENTSGSDGRINGTTFSSQLADLSEDLVDRYLLISNGSKYLKYKVIEYLTNKSLKIESIFGGDPLVNQNEDRQYYIGGTVFDDLIYNTYTKSWIMYYEYLPTVGGWFEKTGQPEDAPYGTVENFCPCCVNTNLGLIVTKHEGCEPFTISKNYDIPLSQWEIDIQHCYNSAHIGSSGIFFPFVSGVALYPEGGNSIPVFYRTCNVYRENCRNPTYGSLPPDVIVDYAEGNTCISSTANREAGGIVDYYYDTNYVLESGNIKCDNYRYYYTYPYGQNEWPVWSLCPDYDYASPFLIPLDPSYAPAPDEMDGMIPLAHIDIALGGEYTLNRAVLSNYPECSGFWQQLPKN